MPSGYKHLDKRNLIGAGRDFFNEVAAGLLAWDLQKRIGLKVAAPPVAKSVETVMRGPLFLRIPVGVIYVVESNTEVGFAYGTLAGHPECGEEYFAVEIDDNERVWMHIRAFWKPGNILVKLSGPVANALQRHFTNKYLSAFIQKCE